MSRLILNKVYPGSRITVFRAASLKRMGQLNMSKFDHENALGEAIVNEIATSSPVLLEYRETVVIRCRCAKPEYYAKPIKHIMHPHDDDLVIEQRQDNF